MRFRVGQATPLVFREHISEDPALNELRYTQRFAIYDTITVQGVSDTNRNITAWLYKRPSATLVSQVTMTKVSIGGGMYAYSVSFKPLETGFYWVILTSGTYLRLVSTEFEVCDELEEGFVNIEYSNTDNDTPLDNIFMINGVRQVMQLRIEGGFKPQGYQAMVSQETWRTQRQELRLLYSMPYEKWALTIGRAQGVPVEYIKIINGILSCNMVYINGQRWCRSEGSVPEKTLTMQGAQMFTATVDLERQQSIEMYPSEIYGNMGSFNNDYNNDYDINS